MPSAPMMPAQSFVHAYRRAREREGRILPDDVVRRLPHVAESDTHQGEWKLRADSSDRLVAHVEAIARPLVVHDLGCGNGWLTARLAALAHVTATGFDINVDDVAQARRVFAERPRLSFAVGEVGAHGAADVVVLASVLQYIAEPPAVLGELLDTLRPGGEIHVLDTPLYEPAEIAAARDRTREHFLTMNVPEMIDRYHHHAWSVFAGVEHDVLYDPAAVRHRLARRVLNRPRSPFAWVRISARPSR